MHNLTLTRPSKKSRIGGPDHLVQYELHCRRFAQEFGQFRPLAPTRLHDIGRRSTQPQKGGPLQASHYMPSCYVA